LTDKRRVSIREVSRLSGVSMATVSRVIHNSGRFSPATEKHVRDVMRQLNYVPDAIAQSMRTRTMPIVGVIMPDIMDENYALMVRTLQSELYANGYSVTVFNTNEDCALAQHFVDMLQTQRACGLVHVPDRDGADINPQGIPIVYFDRQPKAEPPENSVIVECNNYVGAKYAVAKLIATGRRTIALLSDERNISSHRERIRGYHDALAEAGLSAGPAYLVNPQRTTEAISALQNVVTDGVPFDGIFCTSIRLTVGALAVLRQAGIPDSAVGVLGFGEHRLHRYGLLPYMAIQEPIIDMSLAAARALITLIRGETPPQRKIVLDVIH